MSEQSPMIDELVEIHGSYADFVTLEDLFDESLNTERMSHYRPIASHRQAFEKLANALNVQDKRCYLITGSYGTGKSHLCLMAANYFQMAADEPLMKQFFDNYAKNDRTAADDLRARRANGRYLIAVCHWGGREDFNDLVLRTVQDAVRREGVAEEIETAYDLARKKLEEWKRLSQTADDNDIRKQLFLTVEQKLNLYSPQTITTFMSRLETCDANALDIFQRIFYEITTEKFPTASGDLIPFLQATLEHDAFRQRFRGLVVFFDEFGDTLQRHRMDTKMFQRLAEFCANPSPKRASLIFIGTLQKGLTTAHQRSYTQTELRTISDRVETVSLGHIGMEEIVSALISHKRSHPLWQRCRITYDDVLNSFLSPCQQLQLFPYLDTVHIRQKIIDDMYPMHPMAVHALLTLSKDLASNHRTVVTFFTGQAESGYQDYIRHTPLEAQGKLQLYTTDLLYAYFQSTLQVENGELREEIRTIVKDYHSSLRELERIAFQSETDRLQFQQDDLVHRLLKILLIYQIIQIPANIDNLAFGLYCILPAEKQALKDRLQTLTMYKVLFLRNTMFYELKRESTIDFDTLLEDYKRKLEENPLDVAVELNQQLQTAKKDLLFLDARTYNRPYQEDKRLLRRFVRVAELGSDSGRESFFDRLDNSLISTDEYEGIALYAICESEEECRQARTLCTRNSSERLVIAIPKLPVPMLPILLEIKALQAIKQGEEAQSFGHQDNVLFTSELDNRQKKLQAQREKLLDAKSVVWYGRYGQSLTLDEKVPHAVADYVMTQLYGSRRNTFAHEDFNQLHGKPERARAVFTALRDAVNKLLDYTVSLVIDTRRPDSHGDKRYLERCLLQYGVLRQVRKEQDKIFCEVETDEHRFQSLFPALASMVQDIRALGPQDKLWLSSWLQKYRLPPYGQGRTAFMLTLAVLCRLFRDDIRMKEQEFAATDVRVTSFEDIQHILSEKVVPQAFLYHRPIRAGERRLLEALYQLFATPASATKPHVTVNDVHAAIVTWWHALPPVAKTRQMYLSPPALLESIERASTLEPFTFLFDDLPATLGENVEVLLTESVAQSLAAKVHTQKLQIEGHFEQVQGRLFGELQCLFQAEHASSGAILAAVQTWYHHLDAYQQDTFAEWHTLDSKALLAQVQKIESLEKTFMESLPDAFKLRPVREWATDQTQNYSDRLKESKALIEANRQRVATVSVRVDPPEATHNGVISFEEKVTVSFDHCDSTIKLYIAQQGVDPRYNPQKRQSIALQEPLVIEETMLLCVAAQDSEGYWSPPTQLRFEKHPPKISVPRRPSTQRVEKITLDLPVTAEQFIAACRVLLQRTLERESVPTEDLIQQLQMFLEEMQKR